MSLIQWLFYIHIHTHTHSTNLVNHDLKLGWKISGKSVRDFNWEMDKPHRTLLENYISSNDFNKRLYSGTINNDKMKQPYQKGSYHLFIYLYNVNNNINLLCHIVNEIENELVL